jgi:hypothetical protein
MMTESATEAQRPHRERLEKTRRDNPGAQGPTRKFHAAIHLITVAVFNFVFSLRLCGTFLALRKRDL